MATTRKESAAAADTEKRPEEVQQELQASSAIRFPPEEEAALLSDSNAEKSTANHLFKSAEYSEAITVYDRALASVPDYLEYEIAVVKSNIAACHLKLSDWKAAIDAATQSLEALARLKNPPSSKSDSIEERKPKNALETEDHGGIVELADDEEDEAEALGKLQKVDQRKQDIRRIRAKALMRRARARSEQGGWGDLQAALEGIQLIPSSLSVVYLLAPTNLLTFPPDYQTLFALSTSLPPSDTAIINTALRSLPPRIAAAKENEMGEMMGKLKELGNGILKPFGLSTDNFKFEKDEKTGGYNIGMNG
ncbi:MAG: hypothetical protein Q9171_006329 [Xanthocarpia ochracea]